MALTNFTNDAGAGINAEPGRQVFLLDAELDRQRWHHQQQHLPDLVDWGFDATREKIGVSPHAAARHPEIMKMDLVVAIVLDGSSLDEFE